MRCKLYFKMDRLYSCSVESTWNIIIRLIRHTKDGGMVTTCLLECGVALCMSSLKYVFGIIHRISN